MTLQQILTPAIIEAVQKQFDITIDKIEFQATRKDFEGDITTVSYTHLDVYKRQHMNGQFVFKNAVVRFSEVINEGLQANNLQVSDIDMLIPHQANLRISQFIQQKFKLTDDQVFNNIQKYGNTTAASIPIALTEAWELGKIKDGDTVVLAAFGSGFTWASAIIKW